MERMTEREALEELKTFPISCLDFKENQALDMAIKALEKQIAKKVQYDEYGKEEGYPYCECGKCLIDDFVGVKHCPVCGQKLDWEEAEKALEDMKGKV